MEANQIMEEQDTTTTMDENEHPSTKEPANEDVQTLPTTETPLEPFISQTPLDALAAETLLDSFASQTSLEILVSKSPLELSIPESHLESHTSKPPLVPSTSQMTLVPPASESPLKPSIPMTSISNIPLEAHTAETDISKVPEKHIFLPSSVTHASTSPSDVLKEDLLSESSSKELPESEHLPKHSLPGPSAHVYMDTSAKQKEEAGEDKDTVDTSGITAFTSQPGYQLGKKKRKKGIIRLYIGWRCPHYLWDCYRIGNESKCFCGHLLKQHQIISDISVPCAVSQCRCLIFCFIPSRPEEVGEFWLRRRATFNPKAWRAQCRCKHSHEDHTANGVHPCRHHGCSCNCFESNFLCAACDRCWEEHETFFETEETRRRGGRPHGADYMPFAEMPVLQEAIINTNFEALQMQGPSGHSSSHPRPPALPSPCDSQSGSKCDPHT